MNLNAFRREVIDVVRAAQAQLPQARLHLVYAPGLNDPLALLADDRRDSATVSPPRLVAPAEPNERRLPRIVTLDCLRVAPWFLETDAGLDDPAFEDSITQAHAELTRTPAIDDDSAAAQVAIGGWIVSRETAGALAHRLRKQSAPPLPTRGRWWVRWTDPDCLGAVWDTLTLAQRQSLLGDDLWVAPDAAGRLRTYRADEPPSPEVRIRSAIVAVDRLQIPQARLIANVRIVKDLLGRWRDLLDTQARTLPVDAEHRMHRHVQAALDHRLDAESIAVYAMTAVQLQPGASDDPRWHELVQRTGQDGALLRDRLTELPDDFWLRWDLRLAEPG